MQKSKRLLIRMIALVCVVAVIATLVVVGDVTSVSAAEFSDTNPELELACIQGNPESMKSIDEYDHESTYYQDENGYTIETNAFVAWFQQDDVAFAYKYYGVKSGGDDYLEASVTANYFTNTDGSKFDLSKGAHHPSTGLMFRNGLGNDAAFIYVHVRDAGQIVVVYRDPTFDNLYCCSNQDGLNYDTSTEMPLQFKMTLKNSLVQISYKSASAATWTKFTPVQMPSFRNGIYAGLCAHSGAEAQTMKATFTDLTIEGIASMGSDDSGSGGGATTEPEVVTPDEALPDASNVLLRETFTDGSLTTANVTTSNPNWSNFADSPVSIKNYDGNRMLTVEYSEVWDVAGKESWSDYSASLDISLTEDNLEADLAAVGLIVRHVTNLFYGYSNYIVVVQNGHNVSIYENYMQRKNTLVTANMMAQWDLRDTFNDDSYSIIGDGKTHTLKVDCFDNKLTVYFDGELVGTHIDDNDRTNSGNSSDMYAVNSLGCVGIYFKNAFGSADNLVVRKLTDYLGGSYDNKIGGNWNEKIPDYIADYGES